LQRTPRGRMATNRAAEYFDKFPPKGVHPRLFS
jgi:Holliday junction resolvasome RuvABC ATP-dependent DNA helicase subunit